MTCVQRAHCCPGKHLARQAENSKQHNEPTAAHIAPFYLAIARSSLSVRSLHNSSIVCSRSISGFLLQWMISDGASPFMGKGEPRWSLHVQIWYCDDQDAEEYCGRRMLSMAKFERWVRHLVSPGGSRKRVEEQRNFRQATAERPPNKR
ncbi:hypothetical protein J2R96_005343 [Bradyrhizobium elkanii]|nr:hypothetical protein [Bradyrhizobium elkanii]